MYLIPPNLVSLMMVDENMARPLGRQFIAIIPSYERLEAEKHGLNHFTMMSNYGKLALLRVGRKSLMICICRMWQRWSQNLPNSECQKRQEKNPQPGRKEIPATIMSNWRKPKLVCQGSQCQTSDGNWMWSNLCGFM